MAVEPRRIAGRAIGATLLGVALYYALWGGEYTAFDLGRLAEQQIAEETRLAATRAEVDSLRQIVESLESDPAAIETVARERFGMIRDGELLYRFVAAEPAPEALSKAPSGP
ncbi:MAG: septum formation initiator family protein [Gemmatimonadota bacterium]